MPTNATYLFIVHSFVGGRLCCSVAVAMRSHAFVYKTPHSPRNRHITHNPLLLLHHSYASSQNSRNSPTRIMAHAHRTSGGMGAQRGVQLFEFSSAHVLESVVFSARSRRFEVCTGHRHNVTTVRCFTPERTVCTIDWDTKTIDVGVGDERTPKRRIEEYLPLNPRRKT